MPTQRRSILIWGKTRPELSKSYREIVCTGGVFKDTGKLCRLYPIPLRFIDDEQKFRKYQWIEASVSKNPSDARPESYKIDISTVDVLGLVPPHNNWSERARWILREGNVFDSVEDLQSRQNIDKTSLGLVKPDTIIEIGFSAISAKDVADFQVRYRKVLAQMDLSLFDDHQVKPLRGPKYRFFIKFKCSDPRCRGHNFSVLDWEVDALYHKQSFTNDMAPVSAAQSVVTKLRQICSEENDLYFFLGNIANHPQTFTIVGIWWPKRSNTDQLSLGL